VIHDTLLTLQLRCDDASNVHTRGPEPKLESARLHDPPTRAPREVRDVRRHLELDIGRLPGPSNNRA